MKPNEPYCIGRGGKRREKMACGLFSSFERDVRASSRLLQGTFSDFTDSGTSNADKYASVVSEMGAPTAINQEAVQAAVEIIMTRFTGIAIIIEEAVKAAVEILTARFRGCFDRKFADFQLELSVKDKEIDILKLQLEVFKSELSALQRHHEPEGKSMEEAATAQAAENENELFSMKEEVQNGGDLEKESVASLQEDKGRVTEQSCRYAEDEHSVINLPVHGDGGLWHQFVQIKEETSTPDTALIKEEICEEGALNPKIQGSELESCCMSDNESPSLQPASAYGSPEADVPVRQMSIHRRCCSPQLPNDREQQEIKTPARDSNRKAQLSAAQQSHNRLYLSSALGISTCILEPLSLDHFLTLKWLTNTDTDHAIPGSENMVWVKTQEPCNRTVTQKLN
ncbi:uncharacterized protein LOC120537027 [Polypterus senegalus]|uniref:uncharacterized protein LOC120537027 n=1 Tax=Polypterus senegalus TaxID=55291 RepID=UPI001966A925|nr:uncharacterized protein LOC120537027 [Polypterus senegalus]